MFERQFLFVLVVAFIFEPSHQQFQRSVPSCEASGQRFCWSCNTAASCVASLGTLKQYNTACSGTTPMCGLDTSSPPKYACTSNAVADCTCTGTGLSYKKDPYNDQWYIVCSGTTATYIDCGPGKYYNEVTHSCGTTPPTTTTTTTQAPSICSTSGPGIYDDPNTCDIYYLCTSSISDPTLGTCQEPNNYFDPEVNTCVSPTPHFQCAADQIGVFGDPFDCRRYYVCFDTELLDVGCCAIDQIFLAEIENCVIEPIPDGCPLSDQCAQ